MYSGLNPIIVRVSVIILFARVVGELVLKYSNYSKIQIHIVLKKDWGELCFTSPVLSRNSNFVANLTFFCWGIC